MPLQSSEEKLVDSKINGQAASASACNRTIDAINVGKRRLSKNRAHKINVKNYVAPTLRQLCPPAHDSLALVATLAMYGHCMLMRKACTSSTCDTGDND